MNRDNITVYAQIKRGSELFDQLGLILSDPATDQVLMRIDTRSNTVRLKINEDTLWQSVSSDQRWTAERYERDVQGTMDDDYRYDG